MTTTVTTAQTGPLTANGTASLPFTFQAISATEIEVLRNGVVAAPNTYTVGFNANGTGSVTPTTPWGSDTVYITSAPTYAQPTQFERLVPLYPDAINAPLDRLARTIIALKGGIARLIPSIGTVTTGVAGTSAAIVPRLSGLTLLWDFVLPRGAAGAPGVNGGAGSSAGLAGLFSAANGMTIAAGITMVSLAGYANAGVGAANYVYDPAVTAATVAANPRTQFVAAVNAPDALGRGFRLDRTYRVTPQMVGALGDGATNDYAALQAWLDLGGALFLPANHFYNSTATLTVTKNVNVDGAGYSFDKRQINYGLMAGARIRFAAGLGGIQVQTFSGLAAGSVVLASPPASVTANTIQEGGMHSFFSNFQLISDSAGAGAGIGFETRTLVHVHNVNCYKFGDEGFVTHGSADIADDPIPYGNASLSSYTNCHAKQNGSHGFYHTGRDAAPIHYKNCDALQNGGWGFLDESLYGATMENCHQASNALGTVKQTSLIAAPVYVGNYIEGGTGSNCEINESAVIIGGLLSAEDNGNTNTANPPIKIGFGAVHSRLFRSVKGESNGATSYPLAAEAYFYHHTSAGAAIAGSGAASDFTLFNKAGTIVASVVTGGTRFNAAVGYNVAGSAVVGARGAAVADVAAMTSVNATNAAAAPTMAEFNAFVAEFNKLRTEVTNNRTTINTLLARLRAATGHGLIA